MKFLLRIYRIPYLLALCFTFQSVCAQTPISISAKQGNDSSWMTQEMPSLKLAQKKFTLKRRLFQNLVTRFNAYYNARSKMKEVMEFAKGTHVDNYDSLLSLLPYSPSDFRSQTGNLDSIIFDASYGIEIHDPRSKWIDNLYLLAGQAYFFKQDYRNAITAFKFIIKYGGAKDEEGRPAIIGSVGYQPQNDVSVSTPEKEKKLFYHTPSRNDAFIWLARAYIDSGEYVLAHNLIQTMQHDPEFPARLQGTLAETEALYYFSQKQTAKGITLLEKATSLQNDKKLKARWEYLLGQYYLEGESLDVAQNHFQQVLKLPSDPLMHFYAALNQSEIFILKNKGNFQTSSQPLLKMAQRDKYDHFRSIIYYRIAQMALRGELPDQAISFLKESLMNNPENVGQKFQSAYLLANIFYNRGNYRNARLYYDSASLLTSDMHDGSTLAIRKNALGDIVSQLDIIDRQDSLQKLAAMPARELLTHLKSIVQDSLKARRRRNMFLQGNASPELNTGINNGQGKSLASDESQSSDQAWYFYNVALKARGFSIFQSQWGKRPLTDNWRGGTSNIGNNAFMTVNTPEKSLTDSSIQSGNIEENESAAVKDLLIHIPRTPEKKGISDDSIMQAMLAEAAIFDEQLRNDTAAANILSKLSERFPAFASGVEYNYRMYMIHIRQGQLQKAGEYRQIILQQFPGSKYAAAFNNTQPAGMSATDLSATEIYNTAYVDYLGGEYDKVLSLKDSAAKIDPHNPQKARFDLLAAMITIKQQSDSAGKIALRQVMEENKQDTPIVKQAAAILNALNHKQELIEHLAHLQLPEENETQNQPAMVESPVQQMPALSATAAQVPKREVPSAIQPAGHVTEELAKPHETDSSGKTAIAGPVIPPPPPVTPYKIDASDPQFVVLAFNRTEEKYINECLQNFSIYNEKMHARDSIEVSTYLLAHNQVILIFRLFPDELKALQYYREIKNKALTLIIPNIPPEVYGFFIISRSNFILLNNTKDYEGYLKFFRKNYR